MVSGKVTMDKYSGALVMNSPEVVAPAADLEKVSQEGSGTALSGLSHQGARQSRVAHGCR